MATAKNNAYPKRTERLEVRVTSEEYNRVAELANTCGLTVSNYVRKCVLGQHPKQRLTDREIEALCSLSDARGDLIRIVSAVKSIQSDKRGLYFHNTKFVEEWMKAAIPLITRWGDIFNLIMSDLSLFTTYRMEFAPCDIALAFAIIMFRL